MPNGHDGTNAALWSTVDSLRDRVEANGQRIAVLEARMDALEDRIDTGFKALNDRLDRTRNTALALLAVAVPVISGLVGALIQAGGS